MCNIDAVLESIVHSTIEQLGKNIDIILVGSAARNEFSGYEKDGKIVAYSDIEIVVILHNAHVKKIFFKSRLSKIYQSIEKKYFCDTGYQGIDFWLMPPSFFAKGNTVFFSESKINGRTLYSGLGFFNDNLIIHEINKIDLREIILHRVINMCFSISKFIDESDLQYALSRNFLDILTIYSWDHGIVKGSYRERIKVIDQLKEIISPELITELQISLSHKLDPRGTDVRSYNDRVLLYLIEINRLAEYLDVWSNENSINHAGYKLYLYKLKYWIINRKIFRFRSIFQCNKKDLLYYIIKIHKFKKRENVSFQDVSKFGLKKDAWEKYYDNELRIIKEVANYHYPYLRNK